MGPQISILVRCLYGHQILSYYTFELNTLRNLVTLNFDFLSCSHATSCDLDDHPDFVRFTNWSVMYAFVDCSQWTSEANTNYDDGERVSSAHTVTACQQACLNNVSCIGVDFNPMQPQGQRCWMSGAWSGRKNGRTSTGITHYSLDRDCVRGTCNICILKQHSQS